VLTFAAKTYRKGQHALDSQELALYQYL